MWGPEAGDSPRPSFPERLLDQLGFRRRVYPPEGAFARLLLRPRHLDEVAVERQVVTDRVLQENETQKGIYGFDAAPPWTEEPEGSDQRARGQNPPASLCLRSCSRGSSL